VSQRDEFRSNCGYYGDKCRKRLYRTKLSLDLAFDHLGEVLDSGGVARYESLLCEALEVHEREAPQLRQKLVRVIVESHFLTLKVNFEYFLNRMLYCLWSWQFEQLVRRKPKGSLTKAVPLRDFAQALSDQGGKEFVIGKVVPAHGLDRMAECFEETTGKSVSKALNACDPKLWSQIHSAFEVRHLIEHRKGKVDQRFIEEVASHSLWKNSSWANFPLGKQVPIQVREIDFEATCDAMVQAVKIITALTSGCWVE
jgi:hypothetical protein